MIDGVYSSETAQNNLRAAQAEARYESMSEARMAQEIKLLEKQMLAAAKNLEFEKAAELRDELKKLKSKLFIGFVEPEVNPPNYNTEQLAAKRRKKRT